jgi:hypothetical protein
LLGFVRLQSCKIAFRLALIDHGRRLTTNGHPSVEVKARTKPDWFCLDPRRARSLTGLIPSIKGFFVDLEVASRSQPKSSPPQPVCVVLRWRFREPERQSLPISKSIAPCDPLIVDILKRKKEGRDCLPGTGSQNLRLGSPARFTEKPPPEAIPKPNPTNGFLLFHLIGPHQGVGQHSSRHQPEPISDPGTLKKQNLLGDFIRRQDKIAEKPFVR